MTFTHQADLVAELVELFPGFADVWRLEAEAPFPGDSLHSVYRAFRPFVAKLEPSPRQLKALAALLNAAVAAGGDSENAVATCFFEHGKGWPLLKALRPLLTADARRLC